MLAISSQPKYYCLKWQSYLIFLTFGSFYLGYMRKCVKNLEMLKIANDKQYLHVVSME